MRKLALGSRYLPIFVYYLLSAKYCFGGDMLQLGIGPKVDGRVSARDPRV